MSRIVQFELPAKDPESCQAFYSQVFGWEFRHWAEGNCWLTKTGKDELPGINGVMVRKQPGHEILSQTLLVKDLDQVARAILDHGGEVLTEKQLIPDVGWVIYFKDTEGNVMGALEADPYAKQ